MNYTKSRSKTKYFNVSRFLRYSLFVLIVLYIFQLVRHEKTTSTQQQQQQLPFHSFDKPSYPTSSLTYNKNQSKQITTKEKSENGVEKTKKKKTTQQQQPQNQNQRKEEEEDKVVESANKKDTIQLCFLTSEFSESIQVADTLPILDSTMIRKPPRHFVFTNLPDLSVSQGWEKIILPNNHSNFLPYKRMITKSRWPKFLGWQHPVLQQQQQQQKCQVIFYGDAYILNPQNESAWQEMANMILHPTLYNHHDDYKNNKKRNKNNNNYFEFSTTVGLMQNKQIGSNNKPVRGPGVELRKNARMGKVSWETANRTIQWLKSRPDYQLGIPVYKNALFGYNPLDERFRAMVLDFWEEYSKEDASWRDQPYWAYFLYKHQISPLPFPFDPPLGPGGERGHNGHIYAEPNMEI